MQDDPLGTLWCAAGFTYLTELAEQTGKLTYRLDLPPSMHQHPVFHINRLSPWSSNEINGQNPPPSCIISHVLLIWEYEDKGLAELLMKLLGLQTCAVM
jgi:hypothetical protein